MELCEIVEYFKNNCDEDGIPNLSNDEWIKFKNTYEKNDIRVALARYVHENDIEFPFRKFDRHTFIATFRRFCSTSMISYYKDFPNVKERYDYKYPYYDAPLGVIDKSHSFNIISNYFQQSNRLGCGSNKNKAPTEIWNDEKLLASMNWTWWREGVMGDSGLTRRSFLTAFRLGTYTATQFKPTVAKALYEKHNAVNVLDTSCGWGDRLAGFYATPSTELYVGCDPNPDVFEVYKEQCIMYETVLGSNPVLTESEDYFECVGKKTVKIWRKPSEDVDWNLYQNTFDFYFTSPPYFSTETYGESTDCIDDQSWSRYDSFDKWKYDFFFKVTELVWGTIKSDGFMMINIIEPSSKTGKRHKLCDEMVDTFAAFDQSNYIGKIGMRMMARPNTEEMRETFIEPVWVFRKNNAKYIEIKSENYLDCVI
jgi:hypothetical protein